ncbi:biotin/lipoyl-containing protein, partial [Ancylobacter polymorphus]
MATEIRVPTLGESVTEATIGKWFKKAGDTVAADEPIVELETDKVTIEVPAPSAGVLSEIIAKDGETVGVGALLGSIGEGSGAAKAAPAAAPVKVEAPKAEAPKAEALKAEAPAPAGASAGSNGPAVAKLAAESGLNPAMLAGTGKDARVTKGDMLAALA